MTKPPATETLRSPSGSTRTVRKKSRSHIRHRRRAILLRLALIIGLLIVVVGVGAVWLAYKADQVKTNLEATMGLLPTLQAQLAAQDTAAAQGTVATLREHTALARSAGTDPVWRAASIVPIIGTNFTAVTEVSVSADDVINLAVTPLLDKFASLDWDALTPNKGKIQLSPLQDAAPTLSVAANTVTLSHDRLADIDRTWLLPQISAPLDQATDALGEADTVLSAASAAAKVLPGMLGADGPRNHLVLIQNSAEVRATGGIPGALAVVSADNGTIELTAQASAGTIGTFKPPLEVDEDQTRIFSDRLGTQIQNVNLTPDFPTAALTASTMWEEKNAGEVIDGVIGLDTVVLSHILRATGPVELKDPKVRELLKNTQLPTALSADNVVQTLLSDSYAEIENANVQDEYFAAVANEVFLAVASGQGESGALVESLMASSEQHRLYAWSSHPEEQKVIAPMAIAGAATGSSVGGTTFGLYFNDGTGAKMDYYVRRTAQLIQTCGPDGYSGVTLRVTLTNTAPDDAGKSLPPYVTGGGVFGVDPGRVKTNIVAYGPARTLLDKARVGGSDASLGAFQHGRRPVGIVTTELAPGQSETVEIDFTQVAQGSAPLLDVTPTIQPEQDVIQPLVRGSSCGPES